MRSIRAGAPVVVAAVERAVTGDTVAGTDDIASPAALQALTCRRALGARRYAAAAGRPTADASDAVEATAAVGAVAAGNANTTRVPAAVERTIGAIAVVGADDLAAGRRLETLACRRARLAWLKISARARPTADAAGAQERTTALRPIGAGTAVVPAAVERAVTGDAVTRTDHGAATGLAALSRLRADATEGDAAAGRAATGAKTVDAECGAAAVARGERGIAGTALVAAAVQRAIGTIAVITADDGSIAWLATVCIDPADAARYDGCLLGSGKAKVPRAENRRDCGARDPPKQAPARCAARQSAGQIIKPVVVHPWPPRSPPYRRMSSRWSQPDRLGGGLFLPTADGEARTWLRFPVTACLWSPLEVDR